MPEIVPRIPGVKEDKFTMVSRSDFIGKYIGHTEKNTEKIVGLIHLASPIISIKPRHDNLGGVPNMHAVNRHVIMGNIIVPAQPFGYNYLGGKLLTLLASSNLLKRQFDEKYGTDLKYFETTSLYGSTKGGSMYDGLKPYVRYIGNTESKFLPLFHDSYFNEMFWWFNEKANSGERLVSADKSSKKIKIQMKMILSCHSTRAHVARKEVHQTVSAR